MMFSAARSAARKSSHYAVITAEVVYLSSRANLCALNRQFGTSTCSYSQRVATGRTPPVVVIQATVLVLASFPFLMLPLTETMTAGLSHRRQSTTILHAP